MKTNYLTKAIATIGLAGSLLCAQSTKADVVEELMGKSILAQDYNEDNSCLFNEEPLAEYFTGVSSRKYEMPKIMKAKISDGELGYDDANELVEYYNNEEAKELAMIQSERELISNSLDELTTQRVDEQSRIEEIDENLEKVPDKNYGSMKNFIDKKRDELEKKVLVYYPNLVNPNRGNLNYNADSPISAGEDASLGNFHTIVEETSDFLDLYEIENTAIPFRNASTVRELLAFYNILSKIDSDNNEMKMRQVITQRKMKSSQDRAELEKEIERLNKPIEILNELSGDYTEKYISLNSSCKQEVTNYSANKELEKKFVAEKDFRKFWGV